MNKQEKKYKEPLIRITRRGEMRLGYGLLIRVAAFAIGMILSGIIALFVIDKLHENPGRIWDFYKCFPKGSFSTSGLIWKFLKNVSILLMIALAITPAYKMKFWNTGAEGQVLVGVLVSVVISKYFAGLPNWLLIILMAVAAVLAGGIWAGIPGVCKALWNTNETLFTLMMNYVATYLTSFVLLKMVPSGVALGIVNSETKKGWLPTIINENFLIIVIGLVMAVVMFIYFKYSKHGYELSVVGESENTARYVGIKVKKVIIRTTILSGLIAGFVGFLICAGMSHSVTTTSVGGQGFTGILVSWMANFNPLVMIGTSALIVFLDTGASQISTTFDVFGAMPDIVVGLILLCIIGAEFFIKYKVHIRGTKQKELKQMEGIK